MYYVGKASKQRTWKIIRKNVICAQDIINLYKEIFYYAERTLRKLNLETIDVKTDDLLDEDYLVLLFVSAVKQGETTFLRLINYYGKTKTVHRKSLVIKRMKTHSNLYEVKDFMIDIILKI